jgi:hypothetical protein
MIEASQLRHVLVAFLTPARLRNDQRAFEVGMLAQLAADFITVTARQADVEQDDFRPQL